MDKGFKTGFFGFRKRQVIAYLQQQKTEHDSELVTCRADAERLERDKIELENAQTQLKAQCEELALQRAALISQKDELSETVKTLEQERTELADALERQTADVEALKTALASRIDEHSEIKAEYECCAAKAQENVIAFENTKNELMSQLEQSRERAAELERENARLKQQLSRIQLKNRLKTDPVRTILSYVKKK